MQDYHLKVGNREHRCARGVLSSNAHIVNLSLAVVLRVNTQLLISLPLSEVEDIGLKTLIIGPITILGFKVVDNVVRLAGSEAVAIRFREICSLTGLFLLNFTFNIPH